MANYHLQGIFIATVMSVFIIIFGASIIQSHVTNYNLPINPANNLSSFNDRKANLSSTIGNAEEENAEASETDTEGILGALSMINKIFFMRDDLRNTQKDVENNLGFLPKEFWVMIGIIISAIFVTIIAGLLWRYNQGLS